MEWYEWVFAFCGVSMALGTVGMSAAIYAELRERGSGNGGQSGRRSGR
ncbi:MAG TPA: hypothetical protein VK358_09870 [Longimicrobium sp.]|nr:hypothetical protein [Longimicrobium sp.]